MSQSPQNTISKSPELEPPTLDESKNLHHREDLLAPKVSMQSRIQDNPIESRTRQQLCRLVSDEDDDEDDAISRPEGRPISRPRLRSKQRQRRRSDADRRWSGEPLKMVVCTKQPRTEEPAKVWEDSWNWYKREKESELKKELEVRKSGSGSRTCTRRSDDLRAVCEGKSGGMPNTGSKTTRPSSTFAN